MYGAGVLLPSVWKTMYVAGVLLAQVNLKNSVRCRCAVENQLIWETVHVAGVLLPSVWETMLQVCCYHQLIGKQYVAGVLLKSVNLGNNACCSDLLQNPLIVPVKVLRGHKITNRLGVMDCKFHPTQPWLFSAGADSTIRLYS